MRQSILVCVVVFAFLASAGDRVTGGGRLDGVNGRATVGFNGNGCNPAKMSGQLQYQDHDTGAKFNGDVIYARQCIASGDCPVCAHSGLAWVSR